MLHGLPDLIFPDRGTQFTSGFSRSLRKLVGITQNLSTAFHPQTDSQTERVNGVLEQYLHGYINYQQDNWVEILTIAEFAYNKTISATTGITPFFALYGQHPRYIIKANPATVTATPIPTLVVLQEWAGQLDILNTYLRSKMAYAQAVQAEQAYKDRLPAPYTRLEMKYGSYAGISRQPDLPPSSISRGLDALRLPRKSPVMLISWTSQIP